jgi:hypothetical protein
MMLDTAVGPVDASRLSRVVEETELPAGKLVSTKFFLDGQLVKLDQDMTVNEAALSAAGFTQELR